MPSPGRAGRAGPGPLAELAAAHGPELRGLAALVLQDAGAAEAAAAEAIVRVARDRGLPRGGEARRLAVLRAGARAIVRAARQAAGVQPTLPLLSAPLTEVTEMGPSALHAALATLPARERLLLALRYGLDLEEPRLVAVLGGRGGRLRDELAAALARVRRHLDSDETIEELVDG